VTEPLPVVYVVRPGNENAELRYSLRSLQNVPHGEVWVVGHRPPHVTNVRHLFVPQRDPNRFKYENALRLLQEIAELGPDRFALFNDDFYCLAPVRGMPLPAHRGPLLEQAAERSGRYGEMLRATAQLLIEAGHADPLAYTLHAPLVMSRAGLQLTLDHGLRHRTSELERLSWRSLYGNLMRLGGDRVPDVKVHGEGGAPAGAWVSTADTSFRYHEIGQVIRRALSRPSPYEQL